MYRAKRTLHITQRGVQCDTRLMIHVEVCLLSDPRPYETDRVSASLTCIWFPVHTTLACDSLDFGNDWLRNTESETLHFSHPWTPSPRRMSEIFPACFNCAALDCIARFPGTG